MKVGIIGGAGYTAGELIRLLINHPQVEIAFIHSSSNAGNPVGSVHSGLEDEPLVFTDAMPLNSIDVLFLCSAHGQSSAFMDAHSVPPHLRIIDLAQDFRDEHDGWVYGLPELQRASIAGATRVANPGCFATAIQLSLLPLAAGQLLPSRVYINGITGSTGAGVKPGATTHFSWRSDNLSVYKPFVHQHLAEISRSLAKLQPQNVSLSFVPLRGDFARGIFVTAVMDCPLDADEVRSIYDAFYRDAPFVSVSSSPINLKQVVNTNRARIAIDSHQGQLLVTCAIDNLLKGASGQAVQNLNIMFGLEETTGLRLKNSAF